MGKVDIAKSYARRNKYAGRVNNGDALTFYKSQMKLKCVLSSLKRIVDVLPLRGPCVQKRSG